MVITEVRIKLVGENNERLQAFCSLTFDDAFVIRDLKIIEGTKGLFVAMPSRKLTDRCNRCGSKNHLRARFCNQCGGRLDENRALRDADGRAKLHADIAHPINSACREVIQTAVLKAYADERERAKLPGLRLHATTTTTAGTWTTTTPRATGRWWPAGRSGTGPTAGTSRSAGRRTWARTRRPRPRSRTRGSGPGCKGLPLAA